MHAEHLELLVGSDVFQPLVPCAVEPKSISWIYLVHQTGCFLNTFGFIDVKRLQIEKVMNEGKIWKTNEQKNKSAMINNSMFYLFIY